MIKSLAKKSLARKALAKFMAALWLISVASLLLCACGRQPDSPEPSGSALSGEDAADVEASQAAAALFSGQSVEADQDGQVFSRVSVQLPQDFYEQLGQFQPDYPAETALCQNISRVLSALADEYVGSRQADDDVQFQADANYVGIHTLEISLFYASENLYSIRAEFTDSSNLAAHPISGFRGYSFDGEGQRLELSALLGDDFPTRAAAAICQRLEKEGELENYFPELQGLLEQGLGQDRWCVDGEQVYLFYDPYEIAAYAMGAQTFALPRK